MRPLLLLLILSGIRLSAANDSCWTVFLHDKSKTPVFLPEPNQNFSRSGFYLFRNCVYEFETHQQVQFAGRLIDISPDTLYLTRYLNAAVAQSFGEKLDTLPVHYKQLKNLRLISDRSAGIYKTIGLEDFNFIFRKDTMACGILIEKEQIYVNDTAYYELVPHLTAQGMGILYEESGGAYYYYGGGMIKADASSIMRDESYDVRNIGWVTPCRVEKINGLALGFFAENIKNNAINEKDSLTINGMNVELNIFGIFVLFRPKLTGPFSDSIEYYQSILSKEKETTINGVNISVANTINETEINGVNISGLITLVDEIDGISLSGFSNFAYLMNGVSIATLFNGATRARGIQIGLINKAADLRGVQFGLWNVNGKRSLPFINWQFRGKKP